MILKKRHITKGTILLGAVVLSNFFNFLFNALLGRWLTFEQFGLITLLITFYYISAVFTNALAATMNFSIGKLFAENKKEEAYIFFNQILRRGITVSLIFAGMWLLLIPQVMKFFSYSEPLLYVMFAPIIVLSTFVYIIVGFFQGKLQFERAGILMMSEPFMKVFSGVLIAALGLGAFAYFSIPISLALASTTGLYLIAKIFKTSELPSKLVSKFPRNFYLIALSSGVGSMVFFSVDIILVKHFFSAEVTGQYALISLIGKMMFFFSTLLNVLTLPAVVRVKDSRSLNKLFLLLFFGTAGLSTIAWISLGVFGAQLTPLLFGDKVLAITRFLPMYTLGIAFYSLSNVIASFHLARQEYIFSCLVILSGIIFGLLILLRHSSLSDITTNIPIVSSGLLLSLLLLHIYYQRRRIST